VFLSQNEMIIFIARTISQQAQTLASKYRQFRINFKKFGTFMYIKKKAFSPPDKTA